MKYWWLEKYKNFKIVQINELIDDINFFLTMPKTYDKQYLLIKDKNIDDLEEEELLLLLYKIVTTKNIKDNSLIKIIEKLLMLPDNSFPKSDYSFNEIIDEVKLLKGNYPFKEKLENNNIAICYNCLNLFYVDKIKVINKKNLCLCPFCLKTKIYFDNDYIPMNYTFIKFANIYYRTSNLGCTFKEVKKLLKKNIKVLDNNKKDNFVDLTSFFSNKIKPIDEKIINKNIYDLLKEKENNYERSIVVNIDEITNDIEFKLLILLVALIDFLSNNIYLKEIIINTNYVVKNKLKEMIKILVKEKV